MASQQRTLLGLLKTTLATPDATTVYADAGGAATTYVYSLTASGAVIWSDEERPLQIDGSTRLAEVHLFDPIETDQIEGKPLGTHERALIVRFVGWVAAGEDTAEEGYLAAIDLAADIRGCLERRAPAWGNGLIRLSVEIEAATGARFAQPGFGVVAGQITILHRARPR